MKTYKAFNEDMTCSRFQYEVGKTYHIDDPIEPCVTGFHACAVPFDVWNFYPPNPKTKYALVEQGGEIAVHGNKTVSSEITIKSSLDLTGLIKAQVEVERVSDKSAHSATTSNLAHSATTRYKTHSVTTGNWAHSVTTGCEARSVTTGKWSNSVTTGNDAHSATTGHGSHSVTMGYEAHSSTAGKDTIAAAFGDKSQAKAAKGSWLILVEHDDEDNILHVKAAKVTGRKIKPDTFYRLQGGNFIEVK